MDKAQVKFIPSAYPTLRKYVKGYYIHKGENADFHSFVTFYQNITTCLSIYKDAKLEGEGRRRKMIADKDAGFMVLLTGKVDKYQEVEFKGPLDRFAIVFYPLGLNHFMQEPLGKHLKLHYTRSEYFEKDLKDLLPQLFEAKELSQKRDLFDDFLLKRLRDFPEKRLLEAFHHIMAAEELPKIQEIAEKLQLSRRTLLRMFQKHLAYSPEEYLSVIRFRKALLNYQKQTDTPRLTEIAYESQYYDQADFNKKVKFRSGLSPKQLFSHLEIVDDVLFWNRYPFEVLSQLYNES
ncbi:MAG: helix-turn-helix domain-containing protein [Bacteroidota bacterium]